jgi:glycosyltransferase involved in cell wall biosynthesis
VALVHDYLLVHRGAERTFAAMAECWPEAPIFTLLYDAGAMGHAFAGRDIRPSYLQRLGVRQKGFRPLLPLFPKAAERLPVHDFDVVVSSSSAFAHGVRPRPDAVHISYCHTPFRYAWHERARALAETPRAARPVADALLNRVQRWDVAASRRVTRYIANSELVRDRIQSFYGHDATVIHPPVDVDRFQPAAKDDFFLVVGELVAHKRVELALEAARRARSPIKVVGDGPARAELTAAHGATADFVGRVSDAELAQLYARARALVVANTEEFGIAAVEAQAAGTPVVAVDAGGVQETVVPGVTGILVEPDDPGALASALTDTDFEAFSSERIRENALRFSPDRFKERLLQAVAETQLSTDSARGPTRYSTSSNSPMKSPST